ncbi:DUF4244 domain-containing protein [Kitasatospora sp. NPDC101157]|uniref:DUF4244 domain-containing protein n=1 Tax=Kitasatospora sp. NPDC101157 TaxID=3364098 RepID=UPI003816ADE2
MTVVLMIKAGTGLPLRQALRQLLGAWRRRSRGAEGRVRRAVRSRDRSDAGMTTAEYAVGTLGACALAAGLYKVVTSTAITGALTEMLERALHAT